MIKLRPYQSQSIKDTGDAYRAGARAPILLAPTGAGKCLAVGTKVMRFDGSITAVEDVRVGDLLMGPDSLPRRVLSTCRDTGSMYRVTPTKGEPWECNDVHVLTLVETVSGKIVDIDVQSYLASNKTFKHCHKQFTPENGIDFESPIGPLPVDPYFLGVWYGDGTKALHSVAVSKPDQEIVDLVNEVALHHGMSVRTGYGSTGCPTYHLSAARGQRNPLLRKIKSLYGDGSSIPREYQCGSRETRCQFLAGLLDTDGYLTKSSFEIVQKNRAIADAIMFIARSLGLQATLRSKFVNGDEYHRVFINGDCSFLPLRLPRKKPPARLQKKIATRVGIKVEPIGQGEYAGFELDGDGRFLLGDFTVTHNTVLASEIIRAVTVRGWRTLFLAHRKELIDQASNKLHDYEIPHGIIMASRRPDRRHPVQVASVATMVNRLGRYDPFDLIVIDECHRSGAPSYRTVVEHYNTPRLLGLTGTPCRLDGKPLGVQGGGLFDVIVPSLTTRELIDAGFLVPYRYFQPETLDLSGVGVRGGEYIAADAAGLVDKPQLIGSVVKHHAEHGAGRPSLIFAASVAHAEHIAEEFRATGLRATACSADTDDLHRKGALVDLANGQLDVAVNVGLWIEGMDCPAISYIGLARPTKSLTYYRQAVGRGFRLHPGKRDLVIMDHANCQIEHGYPCIHIDWSLDGRPKREKSEDCAVRRCPRCYAVVEASRRICDGVLPDGRVCGFTFTAMPPREIRQKEGELREADLSAVIAEEARKAAERRAAEGAARTPEALAALAQERGYAAGWAVHRQQARDEKEALIRRVIELRALQGEGPGGARAMKPKALRAEIAERLQRQADIDEAEVV